MDPHFDFEYHKWKLSWSHLSNFTFISDQYAWQYYVQMAAVNSVSNDKQFICTFFLM